MVYVVGPFGNEDHSRLSAVAQLSGGIRAVSRSADIDASNLARFLASGAGLSEEKILRLVATLGRPNWQSDKARVVVLRGKRANDDVLGALQWYVPHGAQVARAAWSAMSIARLKKFLRANLTPEMYAITDGQTRLLLQMPAGPMLPKSLYPEQFPTLRWWEDDPARAVLDIEVPEQWAAGNVTPPEFDAAWPGHGYDPSVEELLKAVSDLRISYAEAIRRLYRGQHK